MRMWILAAGAAALAVTTPALADPKGGGQGGGKDRGAKAERGGGQSKAIAPLPVASGTTAAPPRPSVPRITTVNAAAGGTMSASCARTGMTGAM